MNPLCRQIRADVLKISQASGHGHVPTCFSVVEMLVALYRAMRHDPARPDWEGRDLFVLSKGHAALGYYCTLAAFGYFDVAGVYGFGSYGARFGCHADRTKVPGVEVSTGALGHGIGVAVGMALAAKIERSDRRVYTLIGDGESNEGSVWEAVMVAANLGLSNLTILYDDNGSQERCLPLANPAERFRAFECDTVAVNGHDLAALATALRHRPAARPRVVVCQTVKGWGCRTLVDTVHQWHLMSPTPAQLEQLLGELDAWAV